ncbi:MAG: hypothetical protein A2798_00745 [Candidatus Levybacteria bacterium RIFCSPHIGHO2_01_FULL_37_17]|nr:MAG: hypothetical protein A2798_00745 [Candidatus Levybacteria bacterium RIFCSPHIGHO2_01_FULL_37_17]OGH36981.1 MAG: hypothetical protein A2959_01605 [Candidatus Levybacteria bacterium RIFCSPLOWO2_01_FULL_38_23]
MDLLVIFVTGLTVGGLTCLAVQGGLLASVITAREKEDIDSGKKAPNPIFPTLTFLTTKLIAYTVLGFILGSLGSVISLTQNLQSSMQLIAGMYMIVIALNLLDIHPIFRYAVIQPPRFITKFVRSKSKSADLFAPGLLGILTILIPCGTTLAMETLAISSSNGLRGAAIMATFVLGTFPMFFGVGVITAKLGETMRFNFLKIAAIILIFLGVSSIYGGLVGVGAPVISVKSALTILNPFSFPENMLNSYPPIKNGVQKISINVESFGYKPDSITLREGVPTELSLITNNTYSCSIAFRIPALNIGVNLQPTGEEKVNLPKLKKGNYLFTCSMGMYQGVFRVI